MSARAARWWARVLVAGLVVLGGCGVGTEAQPVPLTTAPAPPRSAPLTLAPPASATPSTTPPLPTTTAPPPVTATGPMR